MAARVSRRSFLALGAGLGIVGAAYGLRRRLVSKVSTWTRKRDFAAPPPLLAHDAARERRTIAVARGGAPAANVDAALAKLGGLGTVIGGDDVVLVKVSAQWWNQGMTNVAAVKRVIEQVLEIPGFTGEVLVFENTHFRLADGSGLARAWTYPSERNVDVPGWNKLGDLIPFFAGRPVGFVGLIDAGPSALSGDHWHDPSHTHGIYGGDGRGPLAENEDRDGYHWDFGRTFRRKRSWVDHAQTPLTWPRFTSPVSGLVVDLRDGVLRREAGRLSPTPRRLRWISLVTTNEHSSTGLTACCKSAMGIVDMSAGRLGTDPRIRDYQSVHYFGNPEASWRMAGPLAHFAREVRAPDLYLAVAEWVAYTPRGFTAGEHVDLRHAAETAHQARTVVAGSDPVAVDAWIARHLLWPLDGANRAWFDLDDENAMVTKFLRYYREVYRQGTLDEKLVEVA